MHQTTNHSCMTFHFFIYSFLSHLQVSLCSLTRNELQVEGSPTLSCLGFIISNTFSMASFGDNQSSRFCTSRDIFKKLWWSQFFHGNTYDMLTVGHVAKQLSNFLYKYIMILCQKKKKKHNDPSCFLVLVMPPKGIKLLVPSLHCLFQRI